MTNEEIFLAKLRTVDQECEEQLNEQIQTLYKDARFNGTKFVFAELDVASKIFIASVLGKSDRISKEIERIFKTVGNSWRGLNTKQVDTFLKDIFASKNYVHRLDFYADSMQRIAAGYGINSLRDHSRDQVRIAAYQAAVSNACRQGLENSNLELRLHTSHEEPESVAKLLSWWRYLNRKPALAVFIAILLLIGYLVWCADLLCTYRPTRASA
ncbi:MAG: hypothetical protein V4646_03910, partial [Pseudomonadota bacterium]